MHPYLLRSLAIFLILTANLWLSWRCLAGSSASVLVRAASVLWGSASLLVWLGALAQINRTWNLPWPTDGRAQTERSAWDLSWGLWSEILQDIVPVAFAGIGLLAMASLLPRPVANRWTALPVYYPLVLLVLIGFYEAPQQGGWRFDWLFLLGPACFATMLAWLIRVLAIWRGTGL